LGDLVLVKDDIEAGRLIAPFDLTVSLGSYWLVAPRFDRLSPAARIFSDWLHDAIS